MFSQKLGVRYWLQISLFTLNQWCYKFTLNQWCYKFTRGYMTLLGYLCKTKLENEISCLISALSVHWKAPFPNSMETEMVPSKLFVSSEAQFFLDSLKIPAFMIIQILFNWKPCTLYWYPNGHVWIPIYKFVICASVINIATDHQLLVNVLANRKYHQRLFKYTPNYLSKQFLKYRFSGW